MKSKKVIITMIIVTGILLNVAIKGSLMTVGTMNIVKIAKNLNNTKEEVMQNNETINTEEKNYTIETQENEINNIENVEKTVASINIKQARTEVAQNNNGNLSSRSSVIRQVINQTTGTSEENIENVENENSYIKIEDVKISFDMDVSKTTGLSKDDFIKLVTNMKYDKTGILEKNAGWIWECCQKYSVNEIFVLGICGIESGWCSAKQHQNTHNYSSLMKGGKLIQYASDEAGFEAMIKLLGEKYLKPGASLYHGATITGVGRCYCDPTSWPKKVFTCMKQVFA